MGTPDPTEDQDYQEYLAFKKQKAAEAEANKPPEYYVWTADMKCRVMQDAESQVSHVDGVQVVARYRVGE